MDDQIELQERPCPECNGGECKTPGQSKCVACGGMNKVATSKTMMDKTPGELLKNPLDKVASDLH